MGAHDKITLFSIPNLEERMEKYVDKSGGLDACWPWTGCLLSGQKRRTDPGFEKIAYGCLSVRVKEDGISKCKVMVVHRLAYRIANGSIPDNLLVCHTCDNPRCCNPRHLYAGTNDDNMRDMRVRGRSTSGERSHLAKLTWPKVREIRCLADEGKSYNEISEVFGVAGNTVGDICRGVVWKDSAYKAKTPVITAGERHGSAKLTWEKVAEIRKLRDEGFSFTKIAEMFDVGATMIGRICRGKAWKHAEEVDDED